MQVSLVNGMVARLGIYIPSDVEKRLKDYVYKKTGHFARPKRSSGRKQSKNT